MCTRVLWHAAEQPVLVGRNMDWKQSLRTNLWTLPRDAERAGADDRDPNPLRWRARFGSVVATAYDAAATDGINEAGLGAHLLWLAEADFGERDARLPALSVATWAQWCLDRFATVAEAVTYLREHPSRSARRTIRTPARSPPCTSPWTTPPATPRSSSTSLAGHASTTAPSTR